MSDIEELMLVISLSSLSWESDFDEEGFYNFISKLGYMVKSIKCGDELEGMLDSKLRRAYMWLSLVKYGDNYASS